MITTVEAVYRNGVFEPLGPVAVDDGERVQLSVQRQERPDGPDWLKQLREGRERLARQYGIFPDSTPLIAEDRLRDI